MALIQSQKVLFKVHKNGSPIVWTLKDSHAAVCFEKVDHALRIATFAESHYKTHKEWPNGMEFSFRNEVNPIILGVEEVGHEQMKKLCAPWGLKLIIIRDIIHIKNTTYAFNGDVEDFEIDPLLRIHHLNSLLWNPSV